MPQFRQGPVLLEDLLFVFEHTDNHISLFDGLWGSMIGTRGHGQLGLGAKQHRCCQSFIMCQPDWVLVRKFNIIASVDSDVLQFASQGYMLCLRAELDYHLIKLNELVRSYYGEFYIFAPRVEPDPIVAEFKVFVSHKSLCYFLFLRLLWLRESMAIVLPSFLIFHLRHLKLLCQAIRYRKTFQNNGLLSHLCH